MDNSYKGKIKCLNCGKRFKKVIERGKVKFICSGYTNYKNLCRERNIIEKDTIDFIISQHDSCNEIDRIDIMDKYNFTIYYKDGTKSEVKDKESYFGIIS